MTICLSLFCPAAIMLMPKLVAASKLMCSGRTWTRLAPNLPGSSLWRKHCGARGLSSTTRRTGSWPPRQPVLSARQLARHVPGNVVHPIEFNRRVLQGTATLDDAKNCILYHQHDFRAMLRRQNANSETTLEVGKAVLSFLRTTQRRQEEKIYSDRAFTSALCATLVQEGNEQIIWEWVTTEAARGNYAHRDPVLSKQRGMTIVRNWNR